MISRIREVNSLALPWPAVEAGDYDAECAASETVISVATEEDRRELLLIGCPMFQKRGLCFTATLDRFSSGRQAGVLRNDRVVPCVGMGIMLGLGFAVGCFSRRGYTMMPDSLDMDFKGKCDTRVLPWN